MFFVFTLGLVTGHVIAWNFWSQPAWVKACVDRVASKITRKAP